MADANESLLESTGYSYSGIVDVVCNEKRGLELLREISSEFQKAQDALRKAEEDVARLTNKKGYIGGCFSLVAKAMKHDTKEPLIFPLEYSKGVVKVTFNEGMFIHERIEINVTQ